MVAASILIQDVTETRAAEREVRAAAQLTREVLDSVVSFIGRLSPNGTLIDANTRAVRATPHSREELIGSRFWDCYWWNTSPTEQARLKDAVARAAAGETIRYDADIRVWTGSEDWPLTIDFQLVPRRDPDGRVIELIPSGIDVTARREAERSTRASLAQLHLALGAAGMGMVTADTEGRLRSANEAFLRLSGPRRGRRNRRMRVDARPSRPRVETGLGRGRAPFPRNRLFRPGEHRPCATQAVTRSMSYAPPRPPKPAPTSVSPSSSTRRASMPTHSTGSFLVNELKHRVRNTLATVQAIASQTARQSETLDAFMKSFSGRLTAIALGHDTLTGEATATADIAELVERQMNAFASTGAGTLRLEGPSLGLDADTAHALGLVLHELATNAAKYGALSASGGWVAVAWAPERADDDGEVPRVRLTWSEADGPPVREPSRSGFGSRLMKSMVVDTLGGELEVGVCDFGSCGARTTLPLRSHQNEGSTRPSSVLTLGGGHRNPPRAMWGGRPPPHTTGGADPARGSGAPPTRPARHTHVCVACDARFPTGFRDAPTCHPHVLSSRIPGGRAGTFSPS